MTKVSVTDMEKVGVEEYVADEAMVILYGTNGMPDIVGDGDITYAKKAAAIKAIIDDICQSKMSNDTKINLILKVVRYTKALIETLEAW